MRLESCDSLSPIWFGITRISDNNSNPDTFSQLSSLYPVNNFVGYGGFYEEQFLFRVFYIKIKRVFTTLLPYGGTALPFIASHARPFCPGYVRLYISAIGMPSKDADSCDST
jgi:hypothetical protein